MKKSIAFKVAVSPLVLGLTMVGCTTSGTSMFQPVAQTAQEERADQRAARSYELAQQTAREGDNKRALAHAEQAVELSPRDSGYRMLLGDLYLKNGRFTSAETAFSDVLQLHPDNERARFSLALAQIALGRNHLALVQLDRLSRTAAAADLGLAYALAGQPDRAVAMLEPAARATGADGRVRQNLALAYALSGDWQKARVTASQDLSAVDLTKRMEEWAAFARPRAAHDQVATMLGVTPVQDPGQPVRLALAPQAPEPVALAQAETVAEPAAMPQQPTLEEEVRYAEAARTLVTPQAPVASDAAVAPATIPASVFAEREEPARPVRKGEIGRYVVQLGAFSSEKSIERAWSIAERRYDLDAYAPVSATVDLAKGTFHRLSVAGFDDQAEAKRACQSIKSKGGACFVRPVSGDAPVRLASRGGRQS